MPHIYLPPRLERQLAERTASYNADLLRSIEIGEDPILVRFSELLQQIHPRLLLVRARETIVPGVALKPGYYHILVKSEGAPWSATPIEGADGEFIVPTSRVFQKLAEGNMRERRNLERWARNQLGEHDANEREKLRDREERKDHLNDLVKAYTQTSVSMTDARPWTQNAQPAANLARGEVKKDKP